MREVYKKAMALALGLACAFVLELSANASGGGSIMGRVPEYDVTDSYEEYLSHYTSAASGTDTVNLTGAGYARTEEMDVTVDGDTVLTGTSGRISWDFEIASPGLYQIDLEYAVLPDGGNEIQFNLLLNGAVPYSQVSPLVFHRMYADENQDYKQMKGNQSFPPQIEVSDWQKTPLLDNEGYYGDSNGLKFYLEAGQNTLTLQAVKDKMMIRGITVRPAKDLPSYAEYLSARQAEGAQIINSAAVRFQGEDAHLKSNPSYFPRNDRTSALSEPYDATYIVLNVIGGDAWKKAGEWIEWDVEVPQSGLYRIATRYKQKESAGFSAVRSIAVNGEVPFAEAEDIRFGYSTSFQTQYFQSQAGDDLYFYFHEGVNTVRLSCSLGPYADVATELQDTIDELSDAYNSITAITSTTPTKYQDYQLTKRLPGLTGELNHVAERLEGVYRAIMDITGGTTDVSASIERTSSMLYEISAHPNKIPDKVTSIADNITALGGSVLTLSQQALTLDWLELQGKDNKLPRAEGNFFQNLVHEFKSFAGSFTNDYNVAIPDEGDEANETITVWISTGREQMEVLRRLINESFTADSHVTVDLKLVDASIIMTAVAGGTGPDVAIGVSSTLPMELGYRQAAYDLSQFSDFDEVASWFVPAAVDCFEFEGKHYGLPDQMSFPVLFYRTDILARYGIMVPETWDELIGIIPSLATYNMQAYLDKNSVLTLGAGSGVGSSTAINSVYLSMLYQNGGELYNEEGTESMLLSEESVDCFQNWTDYYTKYGFSPSINFVTRFRLGSVPLAIMDISNYNTLSISAPEISGKWGVSLVPGTRKADGTVDHTVPVVTSSVVMISSTVERRHSEEASWKFIKWWLSSDIQSAYSREMEAVLGSSGRFMVANLESFTHTSWPVDVYNVLEESLGWLREIRQIPGSYICGRNLDNAFYAVLNEKKDLLDTLAGYTESLNVEIAKKRAEYGLETE